MPQSIAVQPVRGPVSVSMVSIQDAYRRGDLDLMDSLDIMTEKSAAFREKFLYLRNEVQANSIDTILKKSNLFVGEVLHIYPAKEA